MTISLLFDSSLKTLRIYAIYNGSHLTVFDVLSNNNEIISNLKYYQSTSKITYIFFYFKVLMFILESVVKIVKITHCKVIPILFLNREEVGPPQ
jgi:hypothetical protein